VPDILIVTDARCVLDELRAALDGPDTVIQAIRSGKSTGPAVLRFLPDIVILDLQIGNMGGMATCLDLRLEEGAGRLPAVKIIMLLDREADVFLAKRSAADGWLVKPLDSLRLRRAVDAVLAGRNYYEGVEQHELGRGGPAEPIDEPGTSSIAPEPANITPTG